jgi:hypothetical protein
MFVLIVVTFIATGGGGPVVTMQDFENAKACENAKVVVLKMVPKAKLECVPKGG